MHYTQTVETSVGILGLDIEVDVEGADPWNMLLGTNLEIGESWAVMIEGGFIGREQVVGSVTYRF